MSIYVKLTCLYVQNVVSYIHTTKWATLKNVKDTTMLEQATIDKVNEIGEGLEAKPAVLITGDTYPHKDVIRELGGTWSKDLQGWFVPLENVVNGQINVDPETQQETEETEQVETPTAKAEPKRKKLTRAQRQKGMQVWNVKLERLVLGKADYESYSSWKVGETEFEDEIIAKTPQQVKVRAGKLVGEKCPKLKFSYECANAKWIVKKNDEGNIEQFTRTFGITGKYRITVW